MFNRSAHPISMDEWHVIWFWRTGRKGFLKVDKQPLVEGMSSGAFTQLTLTLDLFIGGHRNFDEVAKAAWISTSFSGCIQKVGEKTLNYRNMFWVSSFHVSAPML
jgi:pikachurin